MGWTFYRLGYGQTPREECRRVLTWEREGRAVRVLADAMVGGVHYAAVELREPCKAPVVFASVILTRRDRGEFGYKDMCESMGPNESKCPAKILNLLSPLDENYGHVGYAAEWRARCRANLAKPKAKPVKAGDVVKFSAPYHIGGAPYDTFQAVAIARRGRDLIRFKTLDGHGPYRLANWRQHVAAPA